MTGPCSYDKGIISDYINETHTATSLLPTASVYCFGDPPLIFNTLLFLWDEPFSGMKQLSLTDSKAKFLGRIKESSGATSGNSSDTHQINTEYGVCGFADVGALPMGHNNPFLHVSHLMNVFDLCSSKEDDEHDEDIQKGAGKMFSVQDLCWTRFLIDEVAVIFQNSDLC